jgi:hypothetical protein
VGLFGFSGCTDGDGVGIRGVYILESLQISFVIYQILELHSTSLKKLWFQLQRYFESFLSISFVHFAPHHGHLVAREILGAVLVSISACDRHPRIAI